MLAGVDAPDAGSVTRPDGLGFLHQELPYDAGSTIAAVLDEALREAREDLAELDRPGGELARVPEDDPRHRELLDAYGRRLGQRRRLALALLVARPPHLLLLDEPTNHLSPRLCNELEAALGTGPGAIVVASHDRWLRRRWRGRELRLEHRWGDRSRTRRRSGTRATADGGAGAAVTLLAAHRGHWSGW